MPLISFMDDFEEVLANGWKTRTIRRNNGKINRKGGRTGERIFVGEIIKLQVGNRYEQKNRTIAYGQCVGSAQIIINEAGYDLHSITGDVALEKDGRDFIGLDGFDNYAEFKAFFKNQANLAVGNNWEFHGWIYCWRLVEAEDCMICNKAHLPKRRLEWHNMNGKQGSLCSEKCLRKKEKLRDKEWEAKKP